MESTQLGYFSNLFPVRPAIGEKGGIRCTRTSHEKPSVTTVASASSALARILTRLSQMRQAWPLISTTFGEVIDRYETCIGAGSRELNKQFGPASRPMSSFSCTEIFPKRKIAFLPRQTRRRLLRNSVHQLPSSKPYVGPYSQ